MMVNLFKINLIYSRASSVT